MLDLKAYRLGFAPLLAALVVLAFSLQGVPEPLEPAVGTIEFDAEGATDSARTLARISPDARPGSHPIHVVVQLQACDDRQCHLPMEARMRFLVPVTPEGGDPRQPDLASVLEAQSLTPNA